MIFALVLLLALGCEPGPSESKVSESLSCDRPYGSYVLTFTERPGGTCGSLGQERQQYDCAGISVGACTGNMAPIGTCSWTVTRLCLKYDRYYTQFQGARQLEGTLIEYQGPELLYGSMAYGVWDASYHRTCSSNYWVMWSRP